MAGPFNLAIRFILELAAVVAASVTGAGLGSPPFGVIGGIAGATLFVVIWGLFLAPRARFVQPPMVRLIVGTVVMELAALGMVAVGVTTAGAILAVAILVNAVGLAVSGYDVHERTTR